MPDQSSASKEHALIQEITAPLATLPDDAIGEVADVNFPMVLRGYDRVAVDAYVRKTRQLVAELQSTRSPEAAVRRALERVGEEVSGILQRAHETVETITANSRTEAEDRLETARLEAAKITAAAEARVKDLDTETDRIWSERHRIVEDARELASQLIALANSAAERFPAEDPYAPSAQAPSRVFSGGLFDAGEAGDEPQFEPEDDADAGETVAAPPAGEPGPTSVAPPTGPASFAPPAGSVAAEPPEAPDVGSQAPPPPLTPGARSEPLPRAEPAVPHSDPLLRAEPPDDAAFADDEAFADEERFADAQGFGEDEPPVSDPPPAARFDDDPGDVTEPTAVFPLPFRSGAPEQGAEPSPERGVPPERPHGEGGSRGAR